LLHDDATRFAKRADSRGMDVTLEVYDDMPHGFPLLPTSAADALTDHLATFTTGHLPAECATAGCSERPGIVRRGDRVASRKA
jgi:acetyl esterase/lipase